jgi:hypothetical protein
MRIDFFEEYPTTETLVHARDITWPCTIYLAAPSLDAYKAASTILASINPRIESAWWPTLARSYWISPFSNTDELFELRRTLRAYNGPRLKILLDLELPLLHKLLLFKNALTVIGGKRIIRSILEMHDRFDFATAEYPPVGTLSEKLKRAFGVSYESSLYHHRNIPMMYTSMIRGYTRFLPINLVAKIRKNLLTTAHSERGGMSIGLGTIARGAIGNEAILRPDQLRQDLLFVRDNGFLGATVFRLGGLNDQNLAVIKEFV